MRSCGSVKPYMPQSGTVTLHLRSSLGLRDAPQFLDDLRDALARGDAVTIDAGDLQEVDVVILQLLVSARKTAAAAGKRLTLVAPDNELLRRLLVKTGFVGPGGESRLPADDFWLCGASAKAGEPA